ncbi:MAG: hypothetical protein RRA94_16675 [Bacteroidota bacterium]|nr:hypothetical protein [Bacteroidota bacterium]
MRALFPFFAILLFPLLFTSCDDDVIEALPSRYVYFADQAGTLQRYDITLKKVENMNMSGVTRLTPVAENGIVLFETAAGTETRLWGYCEDGSTVPVPQPVTASPAEEYIYGAGEATLSREGHHAAWSVYRRPAGSTDTTEWTQELCRFDCAAWTMKQVDVTSFLRAQFEGSNFIPDIVIVRDMLISNDGGSVVFVVDMTDIQAGTVRARQSLILRWRGDALEMLQGNRDGFRILFFDDACDRLFYMVGLRGYEYDCVSGTVVTKSFATTRYDLLRAGAFSAAREEYLASRSDGVLLSLAGIDGGTHTAVIAGIRDLTAYYPEIIFGELQNWASVSPDGEWVTFAWIGDSVEYLFVVRRDGTDLRRIAEGRFPVPAVVSDEAPL